MLLTLTLNLPIVADASTSHSTVLSFTNLPPLTASLPPKLHDSSGLSVNLLPLIVRVVFLPELISSKEGTIESTTGTSSQ